ncbi:MAG: hypothetical protein HY822_25650 [Acidobacteria bacterium]|nr:hypothetical protein [Acidobacteriota bacterium]
MRILVYLLAAAAAAQTAHYQFAFDQDALSGAPDLSHLNRALAAADRLFIRNGHFTRVGEDLVRNTEDDERIRLFGVNLAFGANFPEEKDAVRIARRLRRLGVNLVRLHHMDTQPDSSAANAGSILTTGPFPSLNPIAVSRLRTFLDALKAEGVYCNLNLKVGYVFRPAVDGVPPHPAFPTQSKPLHIIHPRMVELQTEFTRKVIDALRLRDDPVLAMAEIENEASLVREWQSSNLDRNLAGDYRSIFTDQWNAFLKAKYSSTDELRAAWGASEPDGPSMLTGNWIIERSSDANGTLERVEGEAVPTLRAVVTQKGARFIIKEVGFSIVESQPYVAEIELRIDATAGVTRNINMDVKQDVSPWRQMTNRTLTLTSQWQKFSMSITPTWGMDGVGRFGLYFEALDFPLYVRNWKLYPAGRRGLGASETLETANIGLVGETDIGTTSRTNDYLLFLADRDKAYLDAMLAAVRDSADPWVPVAGTQMSYGGLLNYDSHDALDYQDNHFYVDHYNFPNVSWDGRDWRMRDQSNAGSGMSAFQSMAAARQAGRPYTVSEFNQPWPNTCAAEIDPALSVFGAFQDWDSIMHFAYSHGRGWDDSVPNGFNINGDWTKFATVGQAAWLFRSDAIRAGLEPMRIPVSKDLRLRATREKRNGAIGGLLTAVFGFDPNSLFVHPAELVKDGEGEIPEAARRKAAAPYVSDTGETTYDPAARLFLIHSPKAAGVLGFPGGKKIAAGAIDVELAASARGFATIVLTPIDQAPLNESRRLLLTNPGHTLRTQPGSNPARPQRIINYPNTTDWWTLEPDQVGKPSGNLNSGSRPIWMERVEAYVTVRTPAARIAVYPLDGAGQRLAQLEARDIERVESGFRLHLQADGAPMSPWFEIVLE